MNNMKTVTVDDTVCTINISKYGNGNTSLQLIDTEDGFPYAVASVNFDEKLPEGEMYIKNYSENAGIRDILIDAQIIGQALGYKSSGHVTVSKHRLLV